jgi:hypothetical protein
VKAFNLATTTQLSAFDVSADVFDPESAGGAIRGDDRFGECEGDIPSFGFSCGTGGNLGFGRFTRAGFDTMSDPCGRDATKHIALKASIVVANANGKLSGPYNLGKPKGCAKPKRK